MTNKNKIIGVSSLLILILLYFIFTSVNNHFNVFNTLEGNNQILKQNNDFYKEQVKQFKIKQDSIALILIDNQKEIDSLKNNLPIINTNKDKSKKDIEVLLNSQMQQWYDNKVKNLLIKQN
jgi:hypothetical protein